jgi:flagellar biosynthesis protein FlhB
MAQGDDDNDQRTESPSPKRLEEARERGQIPRSRELSTAAVMLIAGVGLTMGGRRMGSQMSAILRDGLTLTREEAMDAGRLLPALGHAAGEMLAASWPVLGLTLLAALAAPLMLGGWAFSTQALAPQFGRLNPVTGIGRMFAMRAWVELVKALAKFAVVGVAGAIVLWMNFDELLQLSRESTGAAIGHAISMSGQALIALTGALVFIAAIDVPFQLWQYHKDLRMTKEEVKQEMKEAEGNPEVKGRIRSMQREWAQRRMMLDVPKADVIVVNPTHYAVALRYDDGKMRAPVVVAKGLDLVALRIRELGNEHGVPIFEAPPLARALHRSVDIGDEIPAGFYVAVAQVLTYIFQLRSARRDHQRAPDRPTIEFEEPAAPPAA